LPINLASLNLRYPTANSATESANLLARARENEKQASDILTRARIDVTKLRRNNADTADAEDQRRSGGGLSQQFAFQDQGLAKLAPLKASLLPSDELALFGDQAVDVGLVTSRSNPISVGIAVDADGEQVAVESIAPQAVANITLAPEPKTQSLAARVQFATAQLYARNNDVVFSSVPATLLAA
jgi:hypothetical protein